VIVKKQLTVILALVVLTMAPALADPLGDVKAAFAKLAATKTYKISATPPNGPAVTGEVVNPDDSHMMIGPMEIIIIRNTTYTKMGGSWTKQTASASSGGASPMALATPGPDAVVRDLGTKTVGGVSLHAYSMQKSPSAPVATVFIDGNGLPARIESAAARGNMVMQLSDFNAPITIVAPI
jgi:hypothetical protein